MQFMAFWGEFPASDFHVNWNEQSVVNILSNDFIFNLNHFKGREKFPDAEDLESAVLSLSKVGKML